ncbi:MAG: MATE family efflux transporter [Lachnospiraceae bacterium]|nr:MATE family efflux transporter [Lachnospiraceae bacterium]
MKTLDMTQGKPFSLILRFAIPLLIGTLFQQVYNLVDTMIVGYGLDENAVGAIGATSALYSVIVYFATGMNNGFGVILARLFGGKQYDQMKKAFASMILLDAAISLTLTVIALPLLRPLLTLLDTPADIFDQAYQYIFVIIAGMITTIAYNMGAGFLRAVGNSRTPLYFLILSCGINLSLDCLFVLVLSWGVAGAAMATVIAQAVSAFCCIAFIVRHYGEFLPEKSDWKPEWALVCEMLNTGLSMGLMSSVVSLGSIVLQRGINQLGTTLVTAHTASRRIYEMLMMPLSTIGSAAATFVSQNYGAGERDRIRVGIRQVAAVQLLWSLFSVLVAFTLGRQLIHLLIGTTDTAIIENAALNLRVCTLFFFPLGLLLMLRNAMQPMGHKIAPVVSSSIELLVKVIFSLSLVPRMGYLGVVITEPIIWVLCFVYLLVIYIVSDKKEAKKGGLCYDGTGEIGCRA